MYSCNKARKHCAKPRCFKYGCEIHGAKLCIDSHLSYTAVSSRSTGCKSGILAPGISCVPELGAMPNV